MPGLVAFGCAKCGIFRLFTHTHTNTLSPTHSKRNSLAFLTVWRGTVLAEAETENNTSKTFAAPFRRRHHEKYQIGMAGKSGPTSHSPTVFGKFCSIVFIDWPGRGRAVGHTYTVWRPAGSVSECGKFEKVFNRLFYFFLQLVFFRGTERKHSLSAGQIQQNPIRGLCIAIMFCLLLLLHDSFISSVRR